MSTAENMAPPADPEVLPLWRELVGVLALFLVARGLLGMLVLFGSALTRSTAARDPSFGTWQAFPDSYFWDTWARWDSGWFMKIVEEGYAPAGDHSADVRKAAFFPLYPYLTRTIAGLTGNHWIAGLLVSNLSLLGALFFLGRIARHVGLDEDGARRTQLYLLAFPTSFFLSSYYSEGLFLLLTTAAMWFYLRRWFLPAGIAGALACTSRHVGLALFVACLLGAAISWKGLKGRRAGAFWLLLMPLGTAAFAGLLYLKMGEPLAFLASHSLWSRQSMSPHQTLLKTFGQVDWALPRNMVNTIRAMDLLSVLPFLALPAFLIRKADPALPAFAWLMVLVPLTSGSVQSLMRCEAVIFPAFLVLAGWGRNRDVDRALVYGMGLFQGLLVLHFGNWFFVG
ncbi:MAG: mannosyltransferase family protein [Isosphaeraceae bacterium]